MERVSSNLIVIKIDPEENHRNDIHLSDDDVQLIEDNHEVIIIDDSDHDLIIDNIPLESAPKTSLKTVENKKKTIQKEKRKRVLHINASKEISNLNHKNIQSELELYLMKTSPKAILSLDEYEEIKKQLNFHAINSTHDGRYANSFPIPGQLLQVDSITFTPKYIKIVCANVSTAKWLKVLKRHILKKYKLVFK